ncbi:hypothetical protein PC9H_001373 [Pleurotus ostreatus]|uniref:Uncharacterized protein n=1 Tax=Pleurotus ostreatus TaxID=5322 RepID=A0A8H7A587_PLEOS|nr:uncharacterized protein PC9H_001373 [Pleurotus ostreatus]KAF7441024.1 hypothetical protein PC9H_001373 [Pleurotus ostreatus]
MARYGLHGFLRLSRHSEEYRNILHLVRGVIVQCFDLNLSVGQQSQESWDLFWEEIQTVFPTRNDPERVSTLRNHVHRYIRDVRCRPRSLPVAIAIEHQADIVGEYKQTDMQNECGSCGIPASAARGRITSPPVTTSMQLPRMSLTSIQQGPMTRSRTVTASNSNSNSMTTPENISIISQEDLTPEYPPPRRCLVPPQPQEYQTYEMCIVALADAVLPRVESPAPPFARWGGTNVCAPSTPSPPPEYPSPALPNAYACDCDCASTPGAPTEGPAPDTGPACSETESQPPPGSHSPDVYAFLRSCVPEMTHLLPLFVHDLGIKNAQSLSALVKWPSQSQNQYFLNLIRDGKVNASESDVIRRRLCEMRTE